MSYFEQAQSSLDTLLKSQAWADVEPCHDALRLFNLQHTHPDVRHCMSNFYQQCATHSEITTQVRSPVNSKIYNLGHAATLPKDTLLLHFVTADAWQKLHRSPSQHQEAWLKPQCPLYLKQRAEKNRATWVTVLDDSAPQQDSVAWAFELGLHHFGSIHFENPIYGFQFKTLQDLPVIKPTWAHAFDGWFFDAYPEGATAAPPHGMARCLKTGQLKRKEWVVMPQHIEASFSLQQVLISHPTGTTKDGVDLWAIGEDYWPAVGRRVTALSSRSNNV